MIMCVFRESENITTNYVFKRILKYTVRGYIKVEGKVVFGDITLNGNLVS